jgi:hypothetical protein
MLLIIIWIVFISFYVPGNLSRAVRLVYVTSKRNGYRQNSLRTGLVELLIFKILTFWKLV